MESNFKAFSLPNAVRAARGYADDDPPLAHFSALINHNHGETIINIHISNNSVEEEPHPYPATIAGNIPGTFLSWFRDFSRYLLFGSPNDQNQLELPNISTEHPDDDEQTIGGNIPRLWLSRFCDSIARYLHGTTLNSETLPERVSGAGILNNSTEENRNFPNPMGDEIEGGGGQGQGEVEVEVEVEEGSGGGDEEVEGGGEGEVEGDSNDDPSNQGINGQQTTRFTNPKLAPFALAMVLTLLGLVIGVLKQGKHTHHIAKPFMLIFVVGLGIAYATYSVFSWINAGLEYKILRGLYYIFCNMAFILLLLMLYTTTA